MDTWYSNVKTRKEHNCWGCRSIIPIGSVVEKIKSVDAGTWSTSYWCPVCKVVLDNLESWEKMDGFRYGEIKDELFDEWNIAAKNINETKLLSTNA